MSLLPMIEESRMKDGEYIHAMPFCMRCNSMGECKQHYENLKNCESGFYSCPHGLSTLVYEYEGNKYIFSSLRERQTYNKENAMITQPSERIYNPILEEAELLTLAKRECQCDSIEKECEKKENEIKELLHEVRKLNGDIKTKCEEIWEEQAMGDDLDNEKLLVAIRNINIDSFIAYNRFQYFDMVRNPELSMGCSYDAGIFKKFDKMRKLLKNYNRRKVWINLEGQCTYKYHIYQNFEALLFVILENALKYSPEGKQVNVSFTETGEDKLSVKITSIGPYCRADELTKVTLKGFRSDMAQKVDVTGQGFGLYFANVICVQHNIDMSFSCLWDHEDHGTVYGVFTVQLEFDRRNQPQ